MVPFVVLVAIVNGMTSPAVLLLFQLAPAWVPTALLGDLRVVLYLCSIATATLTLLVAGVPAALYERFAGTGRTDGTSSAIWLIAAVLLTLPGLHAAVIGASPL